MDPEFEKSVHNFWSVQPFTKPQYIGDSDHEQVRCTCYRHTENKLLRINKASTPGELKEKRTSFIHPLLSFFSRPALIEATPVLYEKSRE
jgi:hypothetical protein